MIERIDDARDRPPIPKGVGFTGLPDIGKGTEEGSALQHATEVSLVSYGYRLAVVVTRTGDLAYRLFRYQVTSRLPNCLFDFLHGFVSFL